jgi:hypothetical protein
MKGYRTIIVMLLGLVFSVLQAYGIGVPESDQAAITGGMIAIVAIVMRICTKGPVGGKQ